ncbi:MAG: GNAT family N-acetyltransferase [Limimaricola sp.]|uniref:GNAT family N-acetyltransferase n=1 Tax=Limimaricola sp. TaxID=2211665 RepID=UPI001DE8768D|nr:GNAT family N-acetyltransferase [Limimaricola sp.]MBI1416358.1 GNAT family N-acetyltransferase [Limimaricola sp.]
MIRPATSADADAIAAIWNHYIRTTTVTFLPDEKTQAEVAALIAGPDPVLVAEVAGRVSGFARYFPFRAGRGYVHTVEHTVLLAPGAEGAGQGRALMTSLVDHARAHAKHSIWAGVSAENEAGVAFHGRLGFVTVARLPEVGFKFGRWIDLVLMQKML